MTDTPRFDLEELERDMQFAADLDVPETSIEPKAALALLAVVKAAQETMEKFDRLYQKAYDADWEGYGEGSVWAINAFRELFAKSMTPSLAPFTPSKEDAR